MHHLKKRLYSGRKKVGPKERNKSILKSGMSCLGKKQQKFEEGRGPCKGLA